MSTHRAADDDESRDVRIRRTTNSAIAKGRRAVGVSAFGATFISAVFATFALTVLDPPSVNLDTTLSGLHRDLTGRLADGTQPSGIDPDARIYAFLAVFAAIAIALAVALDATGRRLRALDESKPKGRPLWESEFEEHSAWAEAGAAFRVLTFIELLVLCAVTGLSAVVASALVVGGAGRLPSLAAWLLTALLLLEATRGFHVWLAAHDLRIIPDALELQQRVDDLQHPSRRRRARRVTTRAMLIGAMLTLAVTGWSVNSPESTTGPLIAILLVSAAAWSGGRAMARSAVLEWGANRTMTIVMASVMTAVLLLFVGFALVVGMASAMSAARPASDAPLWWALGATVALAAAGVMNVVDAGGVAPRSSSALSWLTVAPPSAPDRLDPRAGAALLLLVTLAGAVALADHASELGPALIVSGTVVGTLALLRCARGLTRLMLTLIVTTTFAAVLAHRIGEASTVHAVLAALLFCVLLIANVVSAPTRTAAAFSILVPITRWIHRQRLTSWEARLTAVGIGTPPSDT